MKDFDITVRLFRSMSGVKRFSNIAVLIRTRTSRLNQLHFENISMTKANFLSFYLASFTFLP